MSSRVYGYPLYGHDAVYYGTGEGGTDTFSFYFGASPYSVDDGVDNSGSAANNDGVDRRLAYSTSNTDNVIPPNSTVTSVVATYRYAQTGTGAEFRTYISDGTNRRFNGSFGAPATYPSFSTVAITWTTDAASTAWTVAKFFSHRYGTRVDPVSNGSTLYWGELSQTINFTLPSAVVTTVAASNVTSTTATLNGTLNPNGATSTYPVSYYFEYGLTASYGSTTTTVGGNIGSSTSAVFANISGLIGGSTYHYRLVGTNADGSTNSTDGTFVTQVSDPLTYIM